MKVSLRFLGGCGGTVTGSCILLEAGEGRLLVDCGLFQGEEEGRNHRLFPFDPREIKWVVLTHAHIDHCGLLPRLYRRGYRRSVVATEATVDLCRVILEDSAHLQQGRKRPLYRRPDVEKALERFEGFTYEEFIHLNRFLRVRLRDAGHILGSAILEVGIGAERDGEMKVVFSGDLGNRGTPLLSDPSVVEEADILVIESTYGDRVHQGREERLEELERIVNRSLEDGGKILIPSFAVGRTQELLYDFNLLVERRRIPRVPIVIDSPMAVAATSLFHRYAHLFDQEARALLAVGDDPLEFAGLYTAESLRESESIWQIEGPAILICPSGMCDGGRILGHLKRYLGDERTEILFVGYQARGTLGRVLQEGAEEVRIDGEPYTNRAKVYTLSGYSAHADREGLLDWLGGIWTQNTGSTIANTTTHLCFKCHDSEVYAPTGSTKSGSAYSGFCCVDGMQLHYYHKTQVGLGTNFACMRCHSAVPHGWNKRRLLVEHRNAQADGASQCSGCPADPSPYRYAYPSNFGLDVIQWQSSGQWGNDAFNNCDMGNCFS